MDLYEPKEPDTRLGRIVGHYGALLTLVAFVAGIAGVRWFIWPYILSAWRAYVAPLLDIFHRVIGA